MAIAPYAATGTDVVLPLVRVPVGAPRTTQPALTTRGPEADAGKTLASSGPPSTARSRWAVATVVTLTLAGAAAAYLRAGATPESVPPIASERAPAPPAEAPRSTAVFVHPAAAITPENVEALPRTSVTRDM